MAGGVAVGHAAVPIAIGPALSTDPNGWDLLVAGGIRAASGFESD